MGRICVKGSRGRRVVVVVVVVVVEVVREGKGRATALRL